MLPLSQYPPNFGSRRPYNARDRRDAETVVAQVADLLLAVTSPQLASPRLHTGSRCNSADALARQPYSVAYAGETGAATDAGGDIEVALSLHAAMLAAVVQCAL